MDFSRITDHLFIGTTPRAHDYANLEDLGVRLVINMRLWWGRRPTAKYPGLQYLRLRTFDSPLVPIPTEALMHGTRAALWAIRDGGKVFVHCFRGRHRSVAMAAAILIAQGLTPEAAMQLIRENRPVADPEADHIKRRIMEFWRIWKTTDGFART